jgi:cytochrome P450
LPALVIAHMVGVPERDANRFMGWTESITAHLPNVPLDLPARGAFNDYILGLLEQRRR